MKKLQIKYPPEKSLKCLYSHISWCHNPLNADYHASGTDPTTLKYIHTHIPQGQVSERKEMARMLKKKRLTRTMHIGVVTIPIL